MKENKKWIFNQPKEKSKENGYDRI
jgi:hypothetical protein